MANDYRLTFEMVAPQLLHKYCNVDPRFYSNVTQTVPNSQVPDEDWHEVERVGERESISNQFDTLKEWADADKEFVRNPKMYRLVSEPKWEEVLQS